MSGAGLFAGEITQAAPVADSPTTKPRSYVWFEYGQPISQVVPVSGEGYALTQDDWFAGPPVLVHPFANEVWPEITMSAVFRSKDDDGGYIFNIMASGGVRLWIRKRPISNEIFAGFDLYADGTLISQGDHEITLDHPTWNFNDWYWMGFSYSQVLNEARLALTNLSGGGEATVINPIITSNIDLAWGPSLTSRSQVAWGMEGSVNGVDPLNKLPGPISQVLIDNSYQDFSEQFIRRKFAGVNGIIDIGPTGNYPFGATPEVYLPRGRPEGNLGTRFIGNLSDLYLQDQVATDLELPPIAT